MGFFIIFLLVACESDPKPNKVTGPITTPVPTELAAATQNRENGVILGIESDEGIDYDGKVGYDYLKVNVKLNSSNPGQYIIVSDLITPDGKFITSGNLLIGSGNIHSSLVQQTKLKKGVNSVPIYFNGKAIREIGMDGPYKISLTILFSGAELEKGELITGEHNYKEYQK